MLPGESFMKTDKNIVAKNKKRKADSKKVFFIFDKPKAKVQSKSQDLGCH